LAFFAKTFGVLSRKDRNLVCFAGRPRAYVANDADSVTVYAADATGNVAPIQLIGGSRTELSDPTGVAVDPVNGDIYVANESGAEADDVTIYSPGAINVYAAGSIGDASPMQTITGSLTGLSAPDGVAVDSHMNIYVANAGTPSITVYAAGQSGNVAPMQTIKGGKTKLSETYGVAVDPSDNIYATDYLYRNSRASSWVTAYAAGANGNVAPTTEIKGGMTKLSAPFALAVH
jgi:DNA-binding beta-propeller fold protein YncE